MIYNFMLFLLCVIYFLLPEPYSNYLEFFLKNNEEAKAIIIKIAESEEVIPKDSYKKQSTLPLSWFHSCLRFTIGMPYSYEAQRFPDIDWICEGLQQIQMQKKYLNRRFALYPHQVDIIQQRIETLSYLESVYQTAKNVKTYNSAYFTRFRLYELKNQINIADWEFGRLPTYIVYNPQDDR